ncbi:MAG: hypothetical protein AB1758_12915 [Candidatus Eremiobacterota bacterium]
MTHPNRKGKPCPPRTPLAVLAAILVAWLATGCTVTTSTSTGGLSVNDFKFSAEGPDGESRSDAKFKAGETVYTIFEVTGFKQGDDKKVTLEEDLKVTGPDGKAIIEQDGISLLDQSYDQAVDTVSAHNKLTLPESAPSGEYKVTMKLKDKVGGGTTTHNSKFTWEGTGGPASTGSPDAGEESPSGEETPEGEATPDTSGSGGGELRVENFAFAESENGGPRDNKTFAADEKVYMLFDIKGFQQGDDNVVWVQQDLKVTNADGEVVLERENIVDLNQEAPPGADNVSANNEIDVAGLELGPGTYQVEISVRDKTGDQTATFADEFTIE